MSRRFIQLAISLLVFGGLSFWAVTRHIGFIATAEGPGKCQHNPVRLCHFTNGGHYNDITVDDDAVLTQGHDQHHDRQDIIPPFSYNDADCVTQTYAGLNWPSGQDIWTNGCQAVTSDSEIIPSPTPTPTPVVTSDVTPTPATSQPGKESRLTDDSMCVNGNFEAIFDLKENGSGIKDALVTFEFNGSTKQVKTDEFGRARTTFQAAAGTLRASAEGFPTQSATLTDPACKNVALDPDRNKQPGQTSQNGQVLGATTLANTGSNTLMTVFGLGSLMTGLVSFWYQARH